jgi:hypothetical protein
MVGSSDSRQPVAVASSLARAVRGSQLGTRWSARLVADAFEAGGGFVVPQPVREVVVRGSGTERSGEEGARRARRQVRHYVVANRCDRMLTLTYRGKGNHDRDALVEHLHDFWRALRAEVGRAIPYVWVPELHPGGHGWHAHAALGSFVPVQIIRACWPHGDRIDIQRKGRVGSSDAAMVERSRIAARYVGKYLGKGFEETERALGRHRYECAQGFRPLVEQFVAATRAEVVAALDERMGAFPLAASWFSDPGDERQSFWLSWAVS